MVVNEEEDTTMEMRRLKTTLAGVMKQIEVSTTSGMLIIIIGHLSGITRTTEQRHQLIKRMEPLTEENKKLKAAMNVIERNIQKVQRE